jgi:hypothetical protein
MTSQKNVSEIPFCTRCQLVCQRQHSELDRSTPMAHKMSTYESIKLEPEYMRRDHRSERRKRAQFVHRIHHRLMRKQKHHDGLSIVKHYLPQFSSGSVRKAIPMAQNHYIGLSQHLTEQQMEQFRDAVRDTDLNEDMLCLLAGISDETDQTQRAQKAVLVLNVVQQQQNSMHEIMNETIHIIHQKIFALYPDLDEIDGLTYKDSRENREYLRKLYQLW